MVAYLLMAAGPDYVAISFWLPKSLRDRLRKLYPRYGDLSKALRSLAQKLVEGKQGIK